MRVILIFHTAYLLTDKQYKELKKYHENLLYAKRMEVNGRALDLSNFIEKNIENYKLIGDIELSIEW
jgi:hypothetical protein